MMIETISTSLASVGSTLGALGLDNNKVHPSLMVPASPLNTCLGLIVVMFLQNEFAQLPLCGIWSL